MVGIEKVWEAAKAEVEAGFSRLPAAAVPGNARIQQCCTQPVPEGRLLKANGANCSKSETAESQNHFILRSFK